MKHQPHTLCTCGKPKVPKAAPSPLRRSAFGFIGGLVLAATLSFTLSFLLVDGKYSASLGLGEITETAKTHFAQNKAAAVFFGLEEDPPVSV